MGNQRNFLKDGGFSQWLYRDHPSFKTITINGVRGKAIYQVNNPSGKHSNLPTYSNSSDMYFLVRDGKVVQGRLYIGRKMALDFDWAHSHTNNGSGEYFPRGTVHVQEYIVHSDGKFERLSDKARHMTTAEIEKYGELIHAFNSDVKFK